MGRHFGRIMQLGYVVDELDAAVDHWVQIMGVGPFFVTGTVPYASVTFRGRPCDAETRVAISSHDGMQIEIIQQTGGGASIFTEFLSATGGGLHHVCALSEDLEADLARWAERGVGVLQGGVTKAKIPFAYLDTDPDNAGRVLELVQPSPGLLKFFDKIDQTCAAWDGQTPRIDL
ncbi:VOC family protein [Anianabacter salinae]|uniref:VOC family protein n=1 Tax=Anianabacter salinae TaxID=2851023 RepID=UPI00225DF15E|nr:VOC family protein [Anianabacter salinae]MBV0911050.1 VOC family protein [Anianabacter salinae]